MDGYNAGPSPSRAGTGLKDRNPLFFKLPINTAVLFFFLSVGWTACSPGSAAGTTDPRHLLHRHYQAIGGLDRLKGIDTVYAEGTTEYDGLQGTFRLWEQHPLQYRLEEDFSVFRQIRGDDGRSSWKKDPNGKVVVLRDEETIKRREIARRFDAFDHLDPESSFFTVSYEGMRQIAGHTCHTIKIANRLNRDVLWYFIDRQTFLLIQSIDQQPDIEIHTRYSDYRNTGGILTPFHDESEILPRQKTETNQVKQLQYNVPVSPARFAIPPEPEPDYRFLEGDRAENIPFRLHENLLYLEVETGGHKGLWLVDSGASMSIIDQAAAEKMGLVPEGSIKGFGFGSNFELRFVALPAFQVQGVRFGTQTIFTFQGLSARFDAPRIDGILGYDFLSRFVVKIDYAKQTLSLFSPATFIYKGDGITMDAPLKDGTFTVTAIVDGRYSGKWSIDLGSFNTSFHFPFADANGLLQRPGVQRYSRGLGGAFLEKTIQFHSMQIGEYSIDHPLITIPLQKGTGATASAERIGNIGNSILRRFTLFLDYRRQRLIIERGADFSKAFPRDHSGLQIARESDGTVRIVFISPGSAGEKAGCRAGDRLLRINRRIVDDFPDLTAVKQAFRQPPGTILKLDILRAKKPKRLKMTLENPYANRPPTRSQQK